MSDPELFAECVQCLAYAVEFDLTISKMEDAAGEPLLCVNADRGPVAYFETIEGVLGFMIGIKYTKEEEECTQ